MRTTATTIAIKETNYELTNPAPTITNTPLSTYTPMPTATITPTSTPTPVPCIANTTSDGIIYKQPSKGRSSGSVNVPNTSLPLYSRLQNKNWWMTSARNSDGLIINGWVNTDNLVNVNQCNGLQTVNLDVSVNAPSKAVYLSEDFTTFNNEWLDESGNLSNRGVSSLHIRSGNNQPSVATLNNISFVAPFSFMTSINRTSFNNHSYVGIKWISVSDPTQFIELRITNKNCSAIWVTSSNTYPPIALGNNAACGNDNIEDYIQLNYALSNGSLQLSGIYNDATLPPIKINGQFNNVQLELVSLDSDVDFNYLIIANIPQE
jgi:hypothetical protein